MEAELEQAIEAARQAHFDAQGATADYAALAASKERARIADCLGELKDFDVRRVKVPAQMAFWINLFNAGVLRDASELRLAARAADVQAFFERSRLRLGEHAYSLDDLQHGLLRGNAPKQGGKRVQMSRGDPRLELMPILFDERTHFALHSACRSSPPLRVFEAGKLDRQLEDATTDYVRSTVSVRHEGALLVVPRLFRWFPSDFGGKAGIVEFIAARLADEATVDKIDRRLGDVKLEYLEFDWTLNRRS
jgi:hypothetical protein